MRGLIFQLLHHLGVPWLLRRARVRNREFAILMFHRVSDEVDPLWPPLPVATFRAIARELRDRAAVVPIDAIDTIGEYPRKPMVALSFDDGYIDFWENALPILREYGLPAHHNVCPGLIDTGVPPWTQVLGRFLRHKGTGQLRLPTGKVLAIEHHQDERSLLRLDGDLFGIDDQLRHEWIAALLLQVPTTALTRLMSWDQLRQCAQAGVHIGSHSMNHRNLSRVADGDTLAAEITESRKRICEEVGIAPQVFSFPNGLHDPLGIELVRKAGYRFAMLSDEMVTIFPSSRDGQGFGVYPRINISQAHWPEEHLRLLGFHQKLRSLVQRRPYVFSSCHPN